MRNKYHKEFRIRSKGVKMDRSGRKWTVNLRPLNSARLGRSFLKTVHFHRLSFGSSNLIYDCSFSVVWSVQFNPNSSRGQFTLKMDDLQVMYKVMSQRRRSFKSRLKWTVLSQKELSIRAKLYGPNDWKWKVIHQTGRTKRLKMDGLWKWTVLKLKNWMAEMNRTRRS